MTGTDKIIAHIEKDAQSAAAEILKAAEEKCAGIRADYEEKASKLYSDRIRAGVQACQEKEDGALRISRMEARKTLLAVKQDMVSQSFAMATDQIVNLPENDYVSFLAKLARQSGLNGDEEIVLNARDRAAVGEKLVKLLNADGMNLKLSDDIRDIAGGLILRRGNVETNSSVELLVDMLRGELSGRLAELLFG